MMMLVLMKRLMRFGNLVWIRLNNAWWLMLLPGAVIFDGLVSHYPHVVRRHRRHPLLASALLSALFWLTMANMMIWIGVAIRWLPQFWSSATRWVSRLGANASVRGKTIPSNSTVAQNLSWAEKPQNLVVFEKNITIDHSSMSAAFALFNCAHVSIVASLLLLKNMLSCGLYCPRLVGAFALVIACCLCCC